MLDYLEQLIKEQKWEEALVVAEQLLLNHDNGVEDQLRLNMALVIARTFLGELSGVILLGDHAARIAADLGDWNSYLTIHHYLGYAFSAIGDWEEAKRVWLNFIASLPRYGESHLFEVTTWFHLGLATERENNVDDAVRYFLQARHVAEKNDNGRQVLGVNHALIAAYTKQGKFNLVPDLLAQSARYLRHNQGEFLWRKAWLHHLQVRANFALATKRYERARLVAQRALSYPEAEPIHLYHIHMILASVAKNVGTQRELVDHYLRARVFAIKARRYDFEVDAAESLYLFVQANPNALDLSVPDLPALDLPSSWFEMDELPPRKPRA